MSDRLERAEELIERLGVALQVALCEFEMIEDPEGGGVPYTCLHCKKEGTARAVVLPGVKRELEEVLEKLRRDRILEGKPALSLPDMAIY